MVEFSFRGSEFCGVELNADIDRPAFVRVLVRNNHVPIGAMCEGAVAVE
jgi:hypothetical protein